MPAEVVATPRAEQQIAGLDRVHAKAFGGFLDDLAARRERARLHPRAGQGVEGHRRLWQLMAPRSKPSASTTR